jgi:hypothetical protein
VQRCLAFAVGGVSASLYGKLRAHCCVQELAGIAHREIGAFVHF